MGSRRSFSCPFRNNGFDKQIANTNKSDLDLGEIFNDHESRSPRTRNIQPADGSWIARSAGWQNIAASASTNPVNDQS